MNNCKICGHECKRTFCSISCSNKYWNPITKHSRVKEHKKCDDIITLNLICAKCGVDFSVTNTRNKLKGRGIPKCCSRKCANSRIMNVEVRNKIKKSLTKSEIDKPLEKTKRVKKIWKCIQCENDCIRSRKFCCIKCKNEYHITNRLQLMFDGLINEQSTLKKYVMMTKEHKCEICGVSEWNGDKIPLTLDHINGRAKDNRYENLRLICPICDRRLPTFGSKNKNSDRRTRHKK